MWPLSLKINGTEIRPPEDIRRITEGAGDFGGNIIKWVVQLVLLGLILLSLGYFLHGALKFITSRGDKEMFKQAREQVFYSLIGLIVSLLSFFALGVIGKVFGLSLIGP